MFTPRRTALAAPTSLAGLLALMWALAFAPQTAAKEMDGRLGLGLEQTLGGASGLALRYFTSDSLALCATLGVDITLVDGDVSAGVVASAGFMAQLSRSEHAHLSVGARATIGYRSLDAFKIIDPTATDSDLHLALEVPIALEVWLADNLSVGAQTGLLIDIVPGGGRQLDPDGAGGSAPPGGIGIGIGAGSVTGTLFILYYF